MAAQNTQEKPTVYNRYHLTVTPATPTAHGTSYRAVRWSVKGADGYLELAEGSSLIEVVSRNNGDRVVGFAEDIDEAAQMLKDYSDEKGRERDAHLYAQM